MTDTPKIRFHPIDLNTAWALAPLRNDPSVQEHVRNPGLLCDADQTEWHKWLVVNKTCWMVAIECVNVSVRPSSDNLVEQWQLIGCGGLTTINWQSRSAELSVYTVPYTWEHEAARMIIKHAFNDLGLHRIEAETITTRRAELCIALGFQNEGASREKYWRNGGYVNADQWGLLRLEWEGE